eukprot:m.35324 g.35324  ORF g.35324 m.35324 type:complete len:313 (+) comp5268_c0_seq1:60-998(+)
MVATMSLGTTLSMRQTTVTLSFIAFSLLNLAALHINIADAGAAACLPTCCTTACGGLAGAVTLGSGGAAAVYTAASLAMCIAECVPTGFIQDIILCPVPAPACTWCFLLTVCFAEHTHVTVLRPDSSGRIRAMDTTVPAVRPGDLVQSLDEATGHPIWTQVAANVAHEVKAEAANSFDFLTITTASTSVTVTTEHVMVALFNNTAYAVPANQLFVGQNVIIGSITSTHPSLDSHGDGLWNHEVIVSIATEKYRTKWELVTERGSVLANDVLVTTICGLMPQTNTAFAPALETWRSQHPNVTANAKMVGIRSH